MKPARRIVILTGSGVSAESGIATFRDADGIWAKYDYRDVATPEGYARDPKLVLDFYNWRRSNLTTVEPNAAHFALAALEKGLASRGGELTLITQNVDNLHERAGSQNLLHMHGELAKVRCAACGTIRRTTDEIFADTACSACGHVGAMRPHVVWFGEMPHYLDECAEAIAAADLFVSIGTSGAVYPAAGFAAEALRVGAQAMELNLEPSENARLFTGSHYGPATQIVPAWAEETLASLSD